MPDEKKERRVEKRPHPPGPSPREMKLQLLHKGPCSSPKQDSCPCPRNCPLHGRCCDCIRHHMEERKMHLQHPREGTLQDTQWLPECLRLAQSGQFDE